MEFYFIAHTAHTFIYFLFSESLCKLGLKTGFIPDSAFSASSELARAYKASNARLDRQEIEVPLQVGAWLSETNTVGEWLQINLNNLTTITGVITQARNTELHWVTKFNIDYKSEGNGNWNVVRDASSNTEFRGNQDNYIKKTNMFDQPVQAIQIRLTVLEWQTRIALRLEYLTC
uniref:Lactadherin-like n=1 Tax=Phallusia mammillata TaxID=59560 RepID=A0A6F9DJZ4_9ASCI|nr:lactadherin-like [Phallusia mammillata]